MEKPLTTATYLRQRIYVKDSNMVKASCLVKFVGKSNIFTKARPHGFYIFERKGKRKSRFYCSVEDWPVRNNANPTEKDPDSFILYIKQ